MVYQLMKVFKASDMDYEVKNNWDYDNAGDYTVEVYIDPSSSGLAKEERSYKKWLIDNGAAPGETVLVIDG